MKNLFDNDLCHVGNKALHLNFLHKEGFNVKPGFVLTSKEVDIDIPFENSVVRSNGLGEDAECSFSGIFRSILHVTSEGMNDAIDFVWLSFDSKKYHAYKEIKGCEVQPGILIQEKVESKYSAVAHVFDDKLYIEHNQGYCSAIVSGVITPLSINLTNATDITHYKTDVKFNELVNILRKIKSYYKNPQEVEMTFDGNLWWVLQTKDLK